MKRTLAVLVVLGLAGPMFLTLSGRAHSDAGFNLGHQYAVFFKKGEIISVRATKVTEDNKNKYFYFNQALLAIIGNEYIDRISNIDGENLPEHEVIIKKKVKP